MIATASKYERVGREPAGKPVGTQPVSASRPQPAARAPQGGFNILVPKANKMGKITWPQWFERELREGGMLHEYLRVEKATMTDRLRKAARQTYGRKPNPKSDWKLLAEVPGRLYHRWQKEDPDFWHDNSNLKRLRRDNDELRHCIHV